MLYDRIPQAVLASAPAELLLTNESHLEKVKKAASDLFAVFETRDELQNLETELSSEKDKHPLALHLAAKLAKSKRIVQDFKQEAHVSVVFAVYKEHTRIRTQEEHPHGENFLLRKISQLQWLFADAPNFSWDLTIVDDGCPENSGQIAQEILAKKYDGDNVRIYFLENAIRENLPVTQPMTATSDSQKGGGVAFGMWRAAQQEKPNHIILFTDADLSTHLGQIGLLADGILNQGKGAAIGSRREDASIVIKKGGRNDRGNLFIYLWTRSITNLNYVVDTQCGFKAFRADLVRGIIGDMIEKKFAFDIELLLKTELRSSNEIVKVPVAWIDSEAASTTTDLQPYLSMLKGMVKMYRKYLPQNERSESFAKFIESMSESQWNTLVANIPTAIIEREPADFGDFSDVSAEDLMQAIS